MKVIPPPDAQPFPKYLEVPAQVPNGELCIVFSAKAVAQRNKHSQAMLVEAAKLAPRHGADLALVYDKDKQKGNAKHALSSLWCERSPANQAVLTLVFGLRMKDHSARTYNNIVIVLRERPYASD